MNPLDQAGLPVEDQLRNWNDLNVEPFDKRDVHPYTRTRVILMNGIEVESIMFSHQFARHTDNPEIRRALALSRRADLSGLLLGIRRGAIVLLMMLGYVYYRAAGEAYALVAIGLVSFAAVAQFAPAMLGGMYWKQGTRNGALCGLSLGFALWAYTLLLPSFARSGWLLDISFIEQGPFGIGWLKPQASEERAIARDAALT